MMASPDLSGLGCPFAALGLVLAVVALGDIRRSEGRLTGRRLAVGVILAQAALVLVVLVIAPMMYVTNAMERMKCQTRLKELASAMHDYEADHGRLPPQATYDGEGRSLLSWRVLLLPYLGESDLYEEFRLDEPWNSPHNAGLLARRPKVFAAPGLWPSGGPHGTFFQVFVGEGAAFEGRKGMRCMGDFPDGTSNTILVVEAEEAVPWTKPEDVPYSADLPLPKLGMRHGCRFKAVMADGFARPVDEHISEETLRAAITRNGGEILGPDW